MKTKYIAKLVLDKTVDDWGPEGASGDCRFIFNIAHTVEAEQLTGLLGLTSPIKRFLEEYGLDFNKFQVFEEDGDPEVESRRRRFNFNQVEDANGSPDEQGAYLADYDLYVETYKVRQVETPDFGLECC